MIEAREAFQTEPKTAPFRAGGRRGFGGLRENILSALRALTQNWLRSALTMSGIVMGVLAIVTLVAILQGVKTEVARQVEGLGANLVIIVPGKLDENGQPNPMSMLGVSSLKDADIEALKAVPGVAKISPVIFVSGVIESADKTASAFVVATNHDGIVMNPTPLAEGRYFTDGEEGKNLVVLGDQPKRDLFGDKPAVGKRVLILGKEWEVVGVLSKPKGDGTLGNMMLGLSNLVYIPSTVARREVPAGQINRIVLQTDYAHPAEKMLSAMTAALKKTHNGRDDFGMLTQQKGLALVIRLLNMAQSLLVLIAALSLFVAGVGIMNIMLVTVTERTREIGIRKTVGARRSDIFAQFVIEAIILSLLGGFIGIALSAALCALVARYSPLTPEITPGLVALAFLVCTFVGLLFGVTPAMRAARLNPIDALRHE